MRALGWGAGGPVVPIPPGGDGRAAIQPENEPEVQKVINARNQSILDNTQDTDEPVIVFRAQDRLTPILLSFYRNQAAQEGCSDEFIGQVEAILNDFTLWQEGHFDRVKTPD